MHTSNYRLFVLLLYFLCPPFASPTILYEGATIISFDESTQEPRVLENGNLLIDGSRIAELSTGPLEGNISSNTTRVNATGKIITPGFIDTRT